MNDYRILMDSYQQLLTRCDEKGTIDKKAVEENIKALEPFAERTREEILYMFDSGAYNDVLKAYCKVAMEDCGVEPEKIMEVLDQIRWLLDTVRANEILKREIKNVKKLSI